MCGREPISNILHDEQKLRKGTAVQSTWIKLDTYPQEYVAMVQMPPEIIILKESETIHKSERLLLNLAEYDLTSGTTLLRNVSVSTRTSES